MTRRRLLKLIGATGLVLCACVSAPAQDERLVSLQLRADGPGYQLGTWLQGQLSDEGMRVRWPDLDEESEPADTPHCVVTWSEPGRPESEVRQLRRLLRQGRGIVYVIGSGERHLRSARSFWGPTDVTVEDLDGGAGSARWVEHPLTDSMADIGAVAPDTAVSGVGGSPLVRAGGRTIAIAFDWGPLGRAVILDSSIIFDPLHTDSPRPAVREFLLRAVRWASEAATAAELPVPPPTDEETPSAPIWGELPEPQGVGRPEYMRAVVDLPTEADGWPRLRETILEALEREHLEIDEPRAREGEPLIAPDDLERAGMLVVGSGREEVHYTEPLTVARFFDTGGRLLFVGHARGPRQKRMIGFNQLLSQLCIAASLGRPHGEAELQEHPITGGLELPERPVVRGGLQIWTPLVQPLVTVRGRPAAGAWQRGDGRLVIIDGELLLPAPRRDEPYPAFSTLLDRAIDWLVGER
ncbi:MAG: hypothetical protein ACP5KN_04370 [Armatimonadota bacterium]